MFMILRPQFDRAKCKWEPVNGRVRCVRNIETGVEIAVRQSVDYTQVTTIRRPGFVPSVSGKGELSMSFAIDRKFPDRAFVLNDRSNPTIYVLMGSLNEIAKQFGGSKRQNTEFVYSVLQGLSAINRLSPFSRNPFFYSDRGNYVGREGMFQFVLPSEDEIAGL
jgi:hypothetical protein